MEHLPDCLVTLGLGLDADERGIRKAYAQRLKRIDQAVELEAFQALRDAYELALRWAAWQRERAAEAEAEEATEPETDELLATGSAMPVPADAPAEAAAHEAPAQPPVVDPAAPEAIGEAVFAAFVARMDQPFKSEEEAQAALDAALADERLVNLEARAFFEWRVACRLVEGWQPGHEFLLGPACTTFHWDTERRQLSVFGRVGAILNAAIDERLIFFRQAAGEFESQRQLIQRLRRGDEPPPAQLADDMPRLRQLAQRYPNWLPIITPRAHAQRWSQRFDELPESVRAARQPAADLRESVGAAPPKKRSSGGVGSYWWVLMVVLALARLAGGLGSEPHARPVKEWQQAAHPSTRLQTSAPEVPHFPLPGEEAQQRHESAPWDAPRPASAPKVARSTVPAPAPAPVAAPPPAPSDLDRRQREAEVALQKALAEAREAALDSVTIDPARTSGKAEQ
jgi:protein TonB